MPENMDSFLVNIKEMVNCCREIQLLLRKDKDFFSQNQIGLVDDSNQKKAELLNRLNNLTTEISSSSQATALWSKLKASQQNLLEELRTEVLACYQYLTINSGIVFANLNQLKNIWDKLVALQPKTSTYNDQGVME